MTKDRISKNCYWFRDSEYYDVGPCLLYDVKKESETCNDWQEK